MRQIVFVVVVMLAVPSVARAQTEGDAVPGRYIALYRGSADAAARAAEREGGDVVFNHAGAGLLVVQSATSNFESRLRAAEVFSGVIADRWIVHATPSPVSGTDTLTGIANAGSSFSADPFTAILLPKQWNILQTETDRAWTVTQGDSSVKVAIVDTGICTHHDDLAGKIDSGLSKSFVPLGEEAAESAAPACIGCAPWEDRHGHGTWVASFVSTNNLGIAGVAPNVRLVAVKVANYRDIGSISTLIRGILYAADAGVDVINVSRYYGEQPIPKFPRGMALLERVSAYATRQGALLVFGAGNNGVDLDHAGNEIGVPAESTNGMSIGATTISDALASYSNHGVSAVTMVAPGGGLPTDPFPDTPLNVGVLAACSVHAVVGACASHTYSLVLGTSFASPMVAGAAALVISRNPQLKGKPQQVKAVLVNSADDLGEPGTDNLFSKGRLNTLRAVR